MDQLGMSKFQVTYNYRSMDSNKGGEKFYLTAEGLQKLKDELQFLNDVRKPELAARLHDAIKQGDLSENADYTAAKEEQGFLEGRIKELETMVRNAALIDEQQNKAGIVRIGSKVTVQEHGTADDEVFMIVGKAEADPPKGKISNESPIGSALVGKKAGDRVRAKTPGGEITFKIVKVE
jgi:transcription elongation factor GreA